MIVFNSTKVTLHGHCRPSSKDTFWSVDAFDDVDVFVDEVLTELATMKDGTRHNEGRHPATAIGAKAVAHRSNVAQGRDGDLVRLFLRHAVAGHRAAVRHPLRYALRTVCPLDPDRPLAPAARPAPPCLAACLRRYCRSAPSCYERGLDSGKKVRGVKIQMAVEKYGIPLAIDVSPANLHDTKGIVPVLQKLADGNVKRPALADLGYRGERLAVTAKALGIKIDAVARGRNGRFVPAESAGWSSGPSPG
jgi:hypothetical protein